MLCAGRWRLEFEHAQALRAVAFDPHRRDGIRRHDSGDRERVQRLLTRPNGFAKDCVQCLLGFQFL